MVIYNKIIPFKGYKAINLFGLIFARKTLSKEDLNHEKIHTALIIELLFIGFYLWYVIEWLILLCKYKNTSKAYRNIRFEKEAYTYEKDENYLKSRSHYSFLRL